MLRIRDIEDNKQEVLAGLKKRSFSDAGLVDQAIQVDKERREIQQRLDKSLAKLNAMSKEIGQLFSSGKKEEGNIKRKEVTILKEETKNDEQLLREKIKQLTSVLIKIPNIPHKSVPSGHSEEDNELIREGGEKPELADTARPHWELGQKFDLLDFDLGNKITGSGFPVYKGKGARLQRALIAWFLDEAIKSGYKEVIPPLMVNTDSAFGTGQLPDKEGQMYELRDDPFYMIPTAEVPLTNIYRDEILASEDLPERLVAYTPCFRREAGSYGKDVRGLNRLHQFDKVEIVQLVDPSESYRVLEEMVGYVENLIQKLGLPYRIVRLCGGDLGFTSALTYDFEVYSAAQDKWLEVSSVSNFEYYQANRMKIRFKDKNKKSGLVHTLNGSALALPRILAALLENNQTGDGIRIPEVLVDYTGFHIID